MEWNIKYKGPPRNDIPTKKKSQENHRRISPFISAIRLYVHPSIHFFFLRIFVFFLPLLLLWNVASGRPPTALHASTSAPPSTEWIANDRESFIEGEKYKILEAL